MCACRHIRAWVCVCVSVKMITGGNSTTSTNYTPASCIHKQCNLCPIDLSNSFNRSTLWPPSFCLPPCSPLCSTRAERGKPSKSFCTRCVPLNNESYLAMREETRHCSQIRRRQFSEPAKMSRCREGSRSARVRLTCRSWQGWGKTFWGLEQNLGTPHPTERNCKLLYSR